uniref:Uncharacterized protein n=1 Tax=Oryza barthii TaxID=65489 RepID=A0A0D3GZP1_9ORYZ
MSSPHVLVLDGTHVDRHVVSMALMHHNVRGVKTLIMREEEGQGEENWRSHGVGCAVATRNPPIPMEKIGSANSLMI